MTRLLEIDDLSAGYGGVPVVRHLDLHVDAGEVVALLGPNGAGKTTTLLTVSGLLPSLAGSVTVLGGPPSTRRPQLVARRGVAHVPEARSLFTQLTVAENLRLGVRRGGDTSVALDYFPALGKLMDRRAGLLSGGEQQMLAVGRALAARPRLLMVDELSLGLAPVVVEQLLPVLRQVADDTGTGVLVVEQHVHLALEIADRAAILAHGELVAAGPADELAAEASVLERSYLGAATID
ncbi:MAG: ABC transporter ATP-binding protein [Acidimicrobiia bacterium]|nr:ABC transporter ATP-binding protein [Acidimicrobiia bacterium]